MKRIRFAAALVILAISAVSCKREYTCICKEDAYLFHQYQNQSTRIETIESTNVKKAEKACIAKNSEELDEEGSGHKTICDVLE